MRTGINPVEAAKGHTGVSELIDTTEMYLRTIFELEEEGIVALRARIAERLGHSGPTVSQTVARMERDGLLSLTDNRHLELTELGRSKAIRVMRKHRLAERLLLDVVGLEWEFVHDEACRWEHVISERVERKLVDILGEPSESPYGNPIPGMGEIGAEAVKAPGFREGVVPVTEVPFRVGAKVRAVLRRLGEPIQTDTELLGRLAAAGVRPSGGLLLSRQTDTVRIEGPTGSVDVSLPVALHFFIEIKGDL